jgi:hypothetical protein
LNHPGSRRALADVCSRANATDTCVTDGVAPRLPCRRARRSAMLMFKKTQLYIGFALAALAEIIVRAVSH